MDLLRRAIRPSTLYFGDCLEVMREWDRGQVDLIYLDPPFKSKANYNILFGDKTNGKSGQFMAFEDTWQWDDAAVKRVENLKRATGNPASKVIIGMETILGPSGMLAYLSYMAERLYECRRVLKSTGSIYLHCDPTASHYLKLLMDALFIRAGQKNFRNEIVWRMGWVSGFKTLKRGWIRNHDTILYYVKTPSAIKRFNKEYIPYRPGYRRRDGSKPTGKGIPIEDTWNCHTEDVLDSIMIKSFSREKTGYPTQKPLALLRRIIKASSNPGDLILDPFCGCGTAVVAAQELDRRWAGIDISPFAVETVMKGRLRKFGIPVQTRGIPVDLEGASMLAKSDPFRFETWAVIQVPGLYPNSRQRGDGGIDGRGTLLHETEDGKNTVVVQVKAGKVTKSQFRDFLHVLDREKAAAGVFMTLKRDQATAPMRREARSQGSFRMAGSPTDFPRVQFWSIEDWFQGERRRNTLPVLPAMSDPITGKVMQETLWESEPALAGLSQLTDRLVNGN